MERDVRRNTIIKELEDTGLMMKSFYNKKQVEGELREFQKLLVSKVFDETHGRELRIDDVQTHINELAVDRGVEQSEEIIRFNDRTEELKVLIAKEIAGNKGERHMNKTLKMVKEKNAFLTNLELSNADFVTEIDGIVITRKAIFLLETKYSVKDMIITPEGNYVEAENPYYIYCNIGEKINTKEYLIRSALLDAGFDKEIKIEKIVVFSNSRTQLSNQFKYISSCYCSQLPHVIDEYESMDVYSSEDIDKIATILRVIKDNKEYEICFDFNEYRFLFADALAYTEMSTDEFLTEQQNEEIKTNNSMRWRTMAKYGVIATGLALVVASKIVKR